MGSRGPFSAAVFNSLIDNKISVTHVVCAGAAPAVAAEGLLPVNHPAQSETLDTLANRLHIPVTHITRPSGLQSSNLFPNQPDYILVACFPFRIPEILIQAPRIACLNIHPSLLPKYRGPDPIFWQLKYGESQTGVSLHLLNAGFDTGPIVMQIPVAYGEGAYKKDIEILLGYEGAKLFSTAVMSKGSIINKMARPQDETRSSYFPSPSENDFQLSPGWSARQAFNFIRGAWPPVNQFTIVIDDAAWIITQALEYNSGGKLPEPVLKNNDELYIQFSPGILHVYGHEA